MTASEIQPSPRLQALTAQIATMTRGGRGTPAFWQAICAARSSAAPEVSLDGLTLVPCRSCRGTGTHRTRGGHVGHCSGHNHCGVCVGGKSLGPADRAEYARRQALRTLEIRRANWRALAALVPVTYRDAVDLADALRQEEIQGTYARRAFDTVAA